MLDDRSSIPSRAGFFFLPQHPDWLWSPLSFLPNGCRGSFLRDKAAGAWSWPLTLSGAEVKNAWSYAATLPYVSTAQCSCLMFFPTNCFRVTRIRRVWKLSCYLGFEVLTAVSMMMAVFWVVASCSLVQVCQRFRGTCCLHLQGDHRLTTMRWRLSSVFVKYLFFWVCTGTANILN
jgi:hypothetical protein